MKKNTFKNHINKLIYSSSSYEELKSNILKFFQQKDVFLFNDELVQFILDKNYEDIFKFLTDEGCLYYVAISKTIKNNPKYSYIIDTYLNNKSIEFVLTSFTKTKLQNIQRDDFLKMSVLEQKNIIYSISKYYSLKSIHEPLNDLIITVIGFISCNHYLLNFVKFLILENKNIKSYSQHNRSYSIEENFLEALINKKLLSDIPLSTLLILCEYYKNCIHLLISNSTEIEHNEIVFAMHEIYKNKRQVKNYIFKEIVNLNNEKLILNACKVVFNTKYNIYFKNKYCSINPDCCISSYLKILFNNLPEELISKRYFIFNKEFTHPYLNKEQTEELFNLYRNDILTRNLNKFLSKAAHLSEYSRCVVLINNF